MKRLAFLALIAIFFCSCQKEIDPLTASSAGSGSTGSAGGTGSTTTTTTGSISASVDGVALTFNTAAQAIRTNVPGGISIAIVGFQGAAGTSDQIAVVVTTTGSLGVGTYSENDPAGSKIASVGYVKYGDPMPYSNFMSSTNPSTVVITTISSTAIAGTFSGDAFQITMTGTAGAKKSITQGKFSVKIN